MALSRNARLARLIGRDEPATEIVDPFEPLSIT